MAIRSCLVVVALLVAATAPAHALTEEEERAKAHFLAGQSYYDQASYSDALREFNEAYRISKRPALLYNIARCFEALEQYGDAVNMLERFLAEDPSTPDRAAIETRIANLKERAAAARVRPQLREEQHGRPPPTAGAPVAAAPSPTTNAVATPAPPDRTRRWTWVVGGVGVGLLAAALGTGVASQLAYDDLNGKCMDGACDPATVSQGRIDRGRNLALATDVLWPVGAAAVATSVVLFFVEGRHARR